MLKKTKGRLGEMITIVQFQTDENALEQLALFWTPSGDCSWSDVLNSQCDHFFQIHEVRGKMESKAKSDCKVPPKHFKLVN